jgi:ligand-binding sensor domain-containing protein
LKPYRTSIILLLLLLCKGWQGYAQQPFSRDYWLNENGSATKVNAIAKDGRGYMWLGTDAGIYRFNGRSFTPLEDSSAEQVTALTAVGDTVWCGYSHGSIAKYIGGKRVSMSFGGVTPGSRITSLKYQWGYLWAGTSAEGMFVFIRGNGYCLSNRNGLSDNYVYALAFTNSGAVIAATDRGVNIISLTGTGRMQIKVRDAHNGLPDNIVRAIAMENDSSQIVWAGFQDGGIVCIDAKTGRTRLQSAGSKWQWGQVNDIMPMRDNHAWVATEEGYLVDCSFSTDTGFILRPYYFAKKRFGKLQPDESGNIWCATVEGLTMVTDNYISYIRMPVSYSLPDIAAMVFDQHNDLYYNQGATLYKCSIAQPEQVQEVLKANAPITCLHEDYYGRLWIGTLGNGLWCSTEGKIKAIKDIPNLAAGQILDISGIRGRLWVSSLNGVEEITFDDNLAAAEVVHHGKHTGTGSDYIYQLYPDRQGNMWMATDGAGVAMYDGKRYHHWDSGTGIKSKVVYSITEDNSGEMWAATLGEGLYEFNGNKWKAIGKQQGLMDLGVSAISSTASGHVIAVHAKGIDEWYPVSSQFRHYNKRLNVDIDSQSNALNCYANDKAGNVWVPFERGMICFHNLPKSYDLRPGIAINEVYLFFKPVADTVNEFLPSENHIGFRFDGINFTNPEKLYYRYKLEGYDTGWLTTNDESVTFPRLPSGQYNFRVQASLSNDFTGVREANYQFTIAIPFWKRTWAIALAVLLLMMGAYGYMRLRVRNLRRSAMLQRERMMAEYEQLKNQVNPHFLFNSLNTLASLIEENGEAAVQYTIQLSDLYRSMLSYKDRDLIYLSEEWTLLQKYVFIQQSRFGDGFQLHVDLPEAISKTRQIVPLALQMLVENAIKHNIVSTARPLDIYISATNDTLTVRNTLNPKMSKEKGAGLGLQNISRRYALMSSRSMGYGIQDNQFIVTLPLL